MNDLAHKEARLNNLVGNLLRIGVLTSVIVVFIGIIIGVFRGDLVINIPEATPTENTFITYYKDLMLGETHAIIETGVLLMLFTPIMRIVFAAIAFYKEKDKLYTFLSLVVLAVIILSFSLGKG
ncbi:DUF1634 domain-containing protein [Riemerella columbipharyngis]|uniref:Uncharacterized membrane protein n=1 Tax=Riemerella columbipharyngis TaxID=1071918 RepID=A0A1G7CGK9_9FLAO|nr:DUF1634 domain-containing protein [Riemerella columbipharyngis]SDE38478.1 Uncharacterized membrane protein [Riemerella columbipharyngis]